MRLGIVASRFNEALASQLLKRARAEAKKLGVRVLHRVACPARSKFRSRCSGWRSRAFDALVALGW